MAVHKSVAKRAAKPAAKRATKSVTKRAAKPAARTGDRAGAAEVRAYLAQLDARPRAALARLRALVRASVPAAVECISYGVPTFKLEGRMLLSYAAARNHCSFFPGGVVAQFADELGEYSTSKGTVRFAPERPIPVALLRRIVRACVARNREKTKRARSR